MDATDVPLASPAVNAFPVRGLLARICREYALLLWGPATAILQVADPRVGAGVALHSQFRKNSWSRLQHTLAAVWKVAFGTRAEAEAVRTAMQRRHSGVRLPGEDAVAGLDPELQLWVLGTLIVQSQAGHLATHRPLTPPEREAYYGQMRHFGSYFGLPQTYGPQTVEAFEAWYRERLDRACVHLDGTSREVAWAVIRPERPLWMRAALGPARFWIAATLPAPLAQALGLQRKSYFIWGRFRLGCALLPATVRCLPALLRFPPAYRQALQRA